MYIKKWAGFSPGCFCSCQKCDVSEMFPCFKARDQKRPKVSQTFMVISMSNAKKNPSEADDDFDVTFSCGGYENTTMFIKVIIKRKLND